MIETPQLNSGFLLGAIVSLIFVVAYPVVLALIAHQRLRVGWRYLAYGALVFFVFQLITRVPAVQLIQAALADQLKASPTLTWAWLVFLALTAGVFEEMGRYFGYRVFMRREEKTWSKAVMYGPWPWWIRVHCPRWRDDAHRRHQSLEFRQRWIRSTA